MGASAVELAHGLKQGEVLLLENTVFTQKKKKAIQHTQKLAKLADVYVNDAFGTAHRAHASTTVVAKYFKKSDKCFGFLMEREIKNGNKVLHESKKPITAVTGGAKVSDKILLLERFLDFADNIIIGGGMAYTFFKARRGKIGSSLWKWSV